MIMKKTILGMLLLCAMSLPGVAETAAPSPSDKVRLRLTQSSLLNFGAALQMWQDDHNGEYPPNLQALVPNYLRHVPPGPFGTAEDWDYSRTTDGRSFQVAIKGQPFAFLGFPDLAFTSAEGLQPGPPGPRLERPFQLAIPSTEAEQWKEEHGYFQRDNHWIGSSLSGPFALAQSGESWVSYAVDEYRGRPGAVVESEKPFAMLGLSGVEIVGTWNGQRRHAYYVTDGQAGWILEYSANSADFSPSVDAMFVDMVKSCGKTS
jgi:hypothetical protein